MLQNFTTAIQCSTSLCEAWAFHKWWASGSVYFPCTPVSVQGMGVKGRTGEKMEWEGGHSDEEWSSTGSSSPYILSLFPGSLGLVPPVDLYRIDPFRQVKACLRQREQTLLCLEETFRAWKYSAGYSKHSVGTAAQEVIYVLFVPEDRGIGIFWLVIYCTVWWHPLLSPCSVFSAEATLEPLEKYSLNKEPQLINPKLVLEQKEKGDVTKHIPHIG